MLQQTTQRARWTPNLAYGVGLITSDGNLSRDGRHFSFVSIDKELVEKFKLALRLKNKIGRNSRGGSKNKKYFILWFSDKLFHEWLNKNGVTPAKSKTIQSVAVPQAYFPDFLRGLFDGDGTFYTFWDKRWPSSFGYQMSFASASPIFIRWLQTKLKEYYGVKGFIRPGDGVENLRYVKRDTRMLYSIMYYQDGLLSLSRKYRKVVSAFAQDEKLQKKRRHGRLRNSTSV